MARTHITLRNDLEELGRMAEFVKTFAESEGVAPKDVFAITLSLDELLTNIVSYGYGDDLAHEIYLAAERVDDSVAIWLEDDARPFDPTAAPAPDIALPVEDREEGGLGIHFVRKLMSEFTYQRSDGKNRVFLRRELSD